MKAGYVDPANLLFAKEHVIRVREVAAKVTTTWLHSTTPMPTFIAITPFTRRRISSPL
jgi:hypothetical protein